MKKILRLKHIKLGPINTGDSQYIPLSDMHPELKDLVVFSIEEQSHWGYEFGSRATHYYFVHKNTVLFSSKFPNLTDDYKHGELLFYVQGSEKQGNNRKLLCTLDKWERIEAAVKKYNEMEF